MKLLQTLLLFQLMINKVVTTDITTDSSSKGFFSGMKRSMQSLQNPALGANLFTGSRNVCGKPGKGGERCTPFGKFSKKDMALSVLFLKCCRMCPGQFAKKLSLLELPNHINQKVQSKFTNAFERHTGKKLKQTIFLETKTKEHGFVANAASKLFYADGDQITESLPCCNICPEQFYSPMDYDDISDPVTSDPSLDNNGGSFIEKEEEENRGRKKPKQKVGQQKLGKQPQQTQTQSKSRFLASKQTLQQKKGGKGGGSSPPPAAKKKSSAAKKAPAAAKKSSAAKKAPSAKKSGAAKKAPAAKKSGMEAKVGAAAKSGVDAKVGAAATKGGSGSAGAGAIGLAASTSGGAAKSGAVPYNGYRPYATKPVGGMSDGVSGLNTGYQANQCCTICPEERFPERYIGDSFKGTSSGGGETSFLEVMRQRNLRRKMKMKKTLNRKSTRQKGFLSSMASSAAGAMGPQSNGVLDPSKRPRPQCCPMCPSLDHMVHGSMEPMGGVFGNGKLGGQMSEQMSLEHALDRSKMDPSLDGSMASGAMGSAAGAAASLFRL